MTTYNIKLTAKEIEALQIAICAERIILEEEAAHLENHNNSGINTNKITLKRQRMKDLDVLFTKLYEAEK